MAGNRLWGDPSLFERLSRDVCESNPMGTELFPYQAAFCWDDYGLPDGSLNPTSVRSGQADARGNHALMAPSQDAVQAAFNKVLGVILPKTERWLLRIPRRITRAGALSAHMYCSNAGGAVILLPYGLLGGLYYVNELYHELKAGAKSRLPEDFRMLASRKLADLIACWVLGERAYERDHFWELGFLLQFLRAARCESSRRWIWAMTTSQQLFVILHEFGHLVNVKRADRQEVDRDLHVLKFSGVDNETRADRWAAERMMTGFPARLVFGSDFGRTRESVFVLFGVLAMLQQTGRVNISTGEIVQRWRCVEETWSPLLGPARSLSDIGEQLNLFERFFFSPGEPHSEYDERWIGKPSGKQTGDLKLGSISALLERMDGRRRGRRE